MEWQTLQCIGKRAFALELRDVSFGEHVFQLYDAKSRCRLEGELMDCPACGEFNSMLATKCACGHRFKECLVDSPAVESPPTSSVGAGAGGYCAEAAHSSSTSLAGATLSLAIGLGPLIRGAKDYSLNSSLASLSLGDASPMFPALSAILIVAAIVLGLAHANKLRTRPEQAGTTFILGVVSAVMGMVWNPDLFLCGGAVIALVVCYAFTRSATRPAETVT